VGIYCETPVIINLNINSEIQDCKIVQCVYMCGVLVVGGGTVKERDLGDGIG
jgi:hypothetical protein